MFCPTCHAEYPETSEVCPEDATPLLASPKIQRSSPWFMFGLLAVVIVVGSAIWMLTH